MQITEGGAVRDIGEYDRHPRKHLVPVTQGKSKNRLRGRNHKVQLYPPIPTKSLRHALAISFLIESWVFHRRDIEVDLPRNTSPHSRFHQTPRRWEARPVMQHEHVLLTRRLCCGRLNQNAKENANSHKPHTARQLNPIPA